MCRANTNNTGENTCIAAVQNSDLRHSRRSRCNGELIIISILQVATWNICWHQRAFAPRRTRAQHLDSRHLPPPLQAPPVSWTTKRLIVCNTEGGWRGGRRKETVTLHQSPVTPRCSVLGHGHATGDAAPHPPARSDNNSLNCQSL